MGYSASTPMRSPKATREMYDFMAENYRPWFEVQPPEDQMGDMDASWISNEWDWTGHLLVGDDLSYNSSKTKIGFDFGSSGGVMGHYGFSLLRWMALRAGKLRKVSKSEFGDLGQTVPVFQYDYDPAWPVLVRSEWEDKAPKRVRWCLVDEHGFKPMRRPWWPPGVSSPDDPVLARVRIPTLTEAAQSLLRTYLQKALTTFLSKTPPPPDDPRIEDALTEPYEFTGDTGNLRRLAKWLDQQGIGHTTEDGPFVLYGFRKEMFGINEKPILAAEANIHAELKRLTALWEAR